MPKQKTKIVSVRLSGSTYKLLQGITKERNKMMSNDMSSRLTVSDTIRDIVHYFGMAFYLGKWNKPLNELRKEFFEFMKESK